jgi:putative Mg2+ transporter-C (MgtC) family protein
MLGWIDVAARLGAAALIGGAIGLNRYAHHKSTGLRTLSLVASGAAALVLATLDTADGSLHADAMSRVIQGIMTGVGFIGAGVIIRGQADDRVLGLTTAAAVWMTAALGALCGIGAWRVTIPLSVVVALILLVGGPIERYWTLMAPAQRKKSADLRHASSAQRSIPRQLCLPRSESSAR